MHEPKGRLIDVFDLSLDSAESPQSVLFLDQLTHIPELGDVLRFENQTFQIAQIDRQRTRNCLTGKKQKRRGSIAVLVNEHSESLMPFVRRGDPLWVTWTPKGDLPWHFETDELPSFLHLNEGWNADPNSPDLWVEQHDQTLLVHLTPNQYPHKGFDKTPEIVICFDDCARYRVTPINDHGWYGGQCRFSGLAPEWGEFYEIRGNTRDDMDATPWTTMGGSGARHFHFYLRDETLEVKARGWCLRPIKS